MLQTINWLEKPQSTWRVKSRPFFEENKSRPKDKEELSINGASTSKTVLSTAHPIRRLFFRSYIFYGRIKFGRCLNTYLIVVVPLVEYFTIDWNEDC